MIKNIFNLRKPKSFIATTAAVLFILSASTLVACSSEAEGEISPSIYATLLEEVTTNNSGNVEGENLALVDTTGTGAYQKFAAPTDASDIIKVAVVGDYSAHFENVIEEAVEQVSDIMEHVNPDYALDFEALSSDEDVDAQRYIVISDEGESGTVSKSIQDEAIQSAVISLSEDEVTSAASTKEKQEAVLTSSLLTAMGFKDKAPSNIKNSKISTGILSQSISMPTPSDVATLYALYADSLTDSEEFAKYSASYTTSYNEAVSEVFDAALEKGEVEDSIKDAANVVKTASPFETLSISLTNQNIDYMAGVVDNYTFTFTFDEGTYTFTKTLNGDSGKGVVETTSGSYQMIGNHIHINDFDYSSMGLDQKDSEKTHSHLIIASNGVGEYTGVLCEYNFLPLTPNLATMTEDLPEQEAE